MLIIEDNFGISEMLSKYFHSKGFVTEVLNNSDKAVNRIIKGKFDYIILDILMPKVTGIDIIHALERKKVLKNQRIIVLSSLDLSPIEKNNLIKKEGIYKCFKKPVLLSKIELK